MATAKKTKSAASKIQKAASKIQKAASDKQKAASAKQKAASAKQKAASAAQNAPARWADLTSAERIEATKRMIYALRGVSFSAGYHVVRGRDQQLRRRSSIERGGEDKAITSDEMLRLIALARDLRRNSETMGALLTQFSVNVIGTTGGKAAFLADEAHADAVRNLRREFAAWARGCEFFDGADLQTVLGYAMRSRLLTGRAVLLFDDGIGLGDSGKIIVFEGDEIANIPDDAFAAKFGSLYTQNRGIIKDGFGRTVGAICSMSQRGEEVFDRVLPDGNLAAFTLVRDPAANPVDCHFAIFQNLDRPNQVVSVPAVANSIAQMIDLEEVKGFEIQSAKKNSQTIATIEQSEMDTAGMDGLDNSPAAPLPADATEEDVRAAIDAMRDDQQQSLQLDAISHAGTIYDVLPPGVRMNLLDTKHPNPNMEQFIEWIQGGSFWAVGIGRFYATGRAEQSYTAFKAEQDLSWRRFEQEQHDLEKCILDWAIRCWARWVSRHSSLPAGLPPDWLEGVSWEWPRRRDVDAVKEQNAIALKLKNGTGSYAEVYGANWREKIDQMAEEAAYLQRKGLIHPMLVTASGQVVDQSDTEKSDEEV